MFSKDDTNRLKGIAILLLIFHHMYRTVGDIEFIAAHGLVMADADLSMTAFCFRICVYMFCFLSSFGMSVGIGAKKIMPRYFLYRLWRLLAPYWFTLVVVNVLYSLVNHKFYYKSVLYFLGDVIPVLDIIGRPFEMFNGVFWYMNYTLILVFVLPIINLITRKTGPLLLILTVLLYGFIPVVLDSPYGGPYASYLFAAEAGVLFQHYDVFGKLKGSFGRMSFVLKTALSIGLILYTAICPYVAWYIIPDDRYGFQSMLHTFGAVSMMILGYLFFTGRYIRKLLVVLGSFSFDMFLIHTMVFRSAAGLLRALKFVPLQYIVSVGICFLCAYILNLFKRYTGWLKLISRVSDKLKTS